MLPATACRSRRLQTSSSECSPRRRERTSSVKSPGPVTLFPDIILENCDSERSDDERQVEKRLLGDYEFIPNISVSEETNSCAEMQACLDPKAKEEYGTARESLSLFSIGNNRSPDHPESEFLMSDTGIEYHRRLSVSMEEINLSYDSRDEEKSPGIVKTIKHSQHSVHKDETNIPTTPVDNIPFKPTMRSSLYSTFAAIEEIMLTPLKSFHEKVRKKLKKLSASSPQQKYENFYDSPASECSPHSNSNDSGEEEVLVVPSAPCRNTEESQALDNTFVFIDEVVSNDQEGPDRLWKREDEVYGCSVTGVADDQLVIPRTPWHSPIRDLRLSGNEEGGLPNISWSSPAVSEICCSPEPTIAFTQRSRYLCRIYVPSWLVWRPKLFAFVCEFGRDPGLNSCVDLLLEEPNPEEHWHVVRPKDITPPEVGEERVIHVPRGMVWVRTSRSGFLTTKARLRDIAQRRPLPCTWRAVTGKSKLVRVLNPRDRKASNWVVTC